MNARDDTAGERRREERVDHERTELEARVGELRPRLEALVRTRLGASLSGWIELDDVVQETFLRAFRAVGDFEPTGSDSLFRWLGGIANHVILEAAKRRRRDVILAVEDSVPATDVSQSTAGRRNERFDRLQQALDSLSADHRRVIVMARVERLPIADVARRMDRSPAATSQLLWRALKSLKDAFGSTDSFHLPDRTLQDRGQDDPS